MTLSPSQAKIAHVILAVLVLVAGLGPVVSELAGVLPATWLSAVSHGVAAASAILLWLSQSPLTKPLLQTRRPQVQS
jgi:hypothetical protein